MFIINYSLTAIGALVREAEHAESKPDFVHKMGVALKEANETEYWIDLLFQAKLIDAKTHESFHPDALELIRLLTAIIRSAKRGNDNSRPASASRNPTT